MYGLISTFATQKFFSFCKINISLYFTRKGLKISPIKLYKLLELLCTLHDASQCKVVC